MTIIRNMVADNLIAPWTSFNNNIFRNFFYLKTIFDMMFFIGEDSYLKFKIQICKTRSIMNVWC